MLLILVEEWTNQACIAGKEKYPSLITKTYFRHVKPNQGNQRGILREQRSKTGKNWHFYYWKNSFYLSLVYKGDLLNTERFPLLNAILFWTIFLHIKFFRYGVQLPTHNCFLPSKQKSHQLNFGSLERLLHIMIVTKL